MSRFNTLYLGDPSDAADALEESDSDCDAAVDDLRIALINAMRRIAVLETQVARLRQDENA